MKIAKAPDDWFGKAVVFNATFPGKSVPASTTVLFDRNEAMEYVQLVQKVEDANPSFTPTEVVDALREHAGYAESFRPVLRKAPAHVLVPTGALTKADLDRLKELSKHSTAGGIETGIAQQDSLGFQVCMGHVVAGMSAGTMGSPRSFSKFGITIDPLYAVTISGDLGQTAVEFVATKDGFADEPCTALIGKGSEATDAELAGDIDGWLIGSTFDGKGPKVSETLRAWYCARGNETGNAADRFSAFAAKHPGSPNPKLKSETESFNTAYAGSHYKGQFARAAVGDPVAAKHLADWIDENPKVLAAFEAWLGPMKTKESANKTAADAADSADAADKF
jgi:hypothetical protein